MAAYVINNIRVINCSGRCDLFVDDVEVLYEVGYSDAYLHVIRNAGDNDTYYEETGAMTEPELVKYVRDRYNKQMEFYRKHGTY